VKATLDKAPGDVAAMFDRVAGRYDLTNAVLSLGRDRVWRAATIEALDILPGDRVADLAAGTGTSAAAAAGAGARVVAADFSLGMLAQVAGRAPAAVAVGADATRLPFADASFDAVTISFGLRNVRDRAAALAEMLRVARPGGRLVVCEFSTPPNRAFATAYGEYLLRALPALARAVSSNPDAYAYLADSIRAWPDQAALAAEIGAAGWREVAYRNLTGGIVALHRARRPEC
jgi:demethylmenaquinone methyltransferase/2-methoxy-6-polyprenyl-1,4-benzoquinol methylase